MNYEDSIRWLKNLKNDIGQGDQRLWHYEQALSEIIDLLQSTKDKINNGTFVEFPLYLWNGCGGRHSVYQIILGVDGNGLIYGDFYLHRNGAIARLRELRGEV